MKQILKGIFFFICAIPLLCKIPYFVFIWKSSPMEADEFYIYAFLPLIALINYLCSKKINSDTNSTESSSCLGATSLAALFGIWAVSLYLQINLITIAIGIVIFGWGINVVYSRRAFMAQIPLLAVMIISTPSVSHWVDYYYGVSSLYNFNLFYFKILIIIFLLVAWNVYSLWAKHYPKIESLVFLLMAALCYIFVGIMQKSSNTMSEALLLRDDATICNSWICENMENSNSDKYIFAKSKAIKRKIFYNNKYTIGALIVEVGNIHDIHPTSVCMKSAGFPILEQKTIYPKIGDKIYQIELVRASRTNSNVISPDDLVLFSWFSSPSNSTSDFLTFRLKSRSSGDWKYYRLQLNANESELDSTRIIETFMRDLSI